VRLFHRVDTQSQRSAFLYVQTHSDDDGNLCTLPQTIAKPATYFNPVQFLNYIWPCDAPDHFASTVVISACSGFADWLLKDGHFRHLIPFMKRSVTAFLTRGTLMIVCWTVFLRVRADTFVCFDARFLQPVLLNTFFSAWANLFFWQGKHAGRAIRDALRAVDPIGTGKHTGVIVGHFNVTAGTWSRATHHRWAHPQLRPYGQLLPAICLNPICHVALPLQSQILHLGSRIDKPDRGCRMKANAKVRLKEEDGSRVFNCRHCRHEYRYHRPEGFNASAASGNWWAQDIPVTAADP
jgi:hypothetical protein